MKISTKICMKYDEKNLFFCLYITKKRTWDKILDQHGKEMPPDFNFLHASLFKMWIYRMVMR